VEASVDTVDRTGVEMEALMAVTVAALTIYDMCKSTDRTMTIEEVALWEKSGGRSGTWRREEALLEDQKNSRALTIAATPVTVRRYPRRW